MSRSISPVRSLLVVVCVLAFGPIAAAEEHHGHGAPEATAATENGHAKQEADLQLPGSLKEEHAELHEQLVALTTRTGPVGEAAKGVAEKLHPHFQKEESYGLPPLAALHPLAQGKMTDGMKALAQKSEELKTRLPEMLRDHKEIVGSLEKLAAAGKQSGQEDVGSFVKKLKLHAQNEEEILYPASILVGEYITLKSGPGKKD